MRRRRCTPPRAFSRRVDGSDERQHRERGEGARARRDIPNARTATDVEALKRAFLDHLQYSQGADEHSATAHDRYLAVAYSVRDRMMRRWIQTQQAYYREDAKQVYYLSLEFLMGRALENNLLNVGLYEPMRRAEGPRPRPRRSPRAGARRGARQRWPGPARGVLPRLARDPPLSGDRLRHPLRVRHLRPGDPQRVSGGAARGVAPLRERLGDPAPGERRPGRPLRPHRARRRRARAAPGAVGGRAPRPGHALRRADHRVPQRHREHAAALARAPHRSWTSPISTRATTSRRSRTRGSPRTSPRSSTRTTSP